MPCWDPPRVQRTASPKCVAPETRQLISNVWLRQEYKAWPPCLSLGQFLRVIPPSKLPIGLLRLQLKPHWCHLLHCSILPSSVPQRYLSNKLLHATFHLRICMQKTQPKITFNEVALYSKCNCAIYNIIKKYSIC